MAISGVGNRLAPDLLQNLPGKVGQDEAGLVHLRVVVLAVLLLLLRSPGARGHLDVAVGVLATDHEADLAAGVGRDRSVGVLDHGENLFAVLLELGDQRKVEPLVLSYISLALSGQHLLSRRCFPVCLIRGSISWRLAG